VSCSIPEEDTHSITDDAVSRSGKTDVKKVAAAGAEDYKQGGNEVKTTK
jgi:hypothetical protein